MDPRILVVLTLLLVSFQASTCTQDDVLQIYLDYKADCLKKMLSLPYPSTGLIGVPHCNRTWDGIACWEDWPAGELAHQPCPTYLFPAGLKAEATRQCMPDGNWQLFELLDTDTGELTNNTMTNWTICSLATDNLDNGDEEHFYKVLTIVRIIYKIGYSMSLVALIVAMAIFLYFRKLWVPRNILHMNLFMSLMLRAIIVFIRDAMADQSYTQSEEQLEDSFVIAINGNSTDVSTSFAGCKTVHVLLQYFSATNYFWLLVEGVYLFSLIMIKVYSDKKNVKWYIIFGWGFPWLFIIPWVIVQVYDKPHKCWDAVWDASYWIILAPVTFSICLNTIIFAILLSIIGYKLMNTHGGESMRLRYRKMAKSTLVLIPLFGVYYIVTIGIHTNPHVKENPIGPLAEFRITWDLILASFQGLLVAVLYCFLNGEVQQQIKRRWEVHRIHRNIINESRRLSDTFYSTRGGRGLLQPARSPPGTQEAMISTTNGGTSVPNGSLANGTHYISGVLMGGLESNGAPRVFSFDQNSRGEYPPPYEASLPAGDDAAADEASRQVEVGVEVAKEAEEVEEAEAEEEQEEQEEQEELLKEGSGKDSGVADVWQESGKAAPRSSASSSSSKESGISVSWEAGGTGPRRDQPHPTVSFVVQAEADRCVEVVSYESSV